MKKSIKKKILFISISFTLIMGLLVAGISYIHHIQKLQLGAGQLRLHVVDLAHNGNIDIRIGTGQREQLITEKYVFTYRKMMGLRADDAGHRQTQLLLRRRLDLQIAFAAGTFEADHIPLQGKQTDRAHHAGTAMGAAVGDGGLLGIQNHRLLLGIAM